MTCIMLRVNNNNDTRSGGYHSDLMNVSISFIITGVTNSGLEEEDLDNDNGGRYCRACLENKVINKIQ